MPGFDRTGPLGQGPMTGGARGECAPGAVGRVGFGGGRRFGGAGHGPGGGGRGYRDQFYATGLTGWQRAAAWSGGVAPATELEALKEQADRLQSALNVVRARIDGLDTETRLETEATGEADQDA